MGKYWICICLAWGLGIGGCTPVQQYRYTEGKIYGTFYHISYASDEDLKEEILRQMESVNASLSMFNPESVIARLNRNETDSTDALFQKMYAMALQVNRKTEGAFDITVGPLVNAWGFGFKQNSFPDSARIDTLRQFVGMDLLTLTEGKLQKKYPEYGITDEEIASVAHLAPIHDIGKIKVPIEILNKNGKLTDEEIMHLLHAKNKPE